MSADQDAVYVYLGGGYVEYSAGECATPIEDLIAQLEEAQEDGATHVVGLSGNHRGAKYARLGDVEWNA